MNKRPLILVTNDDGITAPGIRNLIQIMNKVGEVIVVAPDSPQSGKGHSITLDSTIYCQKIENTDGPQVEYSCSGTPADCVKLAKGQILDRKIDLCVSGINHGLNSSISVVYSGTMSAAIEAGIEGIPSIGFSLDDHSWKANFDNLEESILKIVNGVLDNKMQEGVVLNVNFPKIEKGEKFEGIKVCRQAKGNWIEEFEKRKHPLGRDYYWMTGKFENQDKGTDTDQWALDNKYISVVPIKFDLTDHSYIKHVNNWGL